MMPTALPWQSSAWDQIHTQIAADRLPHAILLQGLPGSGRRQFADALCAWLLCEAVSDGAQAPCGQCRQCMLFAGGNHPDVLILEPEEGSQSIKIDQVRRLTQFVSQTSNQTSNRSSKLGEVAKLIVLKPAEALGPAAANSLLKNLEEPPGKTLFLLVAEPGTGLMATIRSRCQPIALGRPDERQALSCLQALTSAEEPALLAALALAPGRPFAALALMEQGVPAWRDGLQQQLALAVAGQGPGALELAKLASAQPASRAISLLEEISAEASRRCVQNKDLPELRRLLAFRQLLLPLKQQLASTANPNELMALEYLFREYLKSRE